MHMAMPMPPPMHSVAKPFLASRFCISCSSVTSTRAPDAPTGWPIAIAPPLTLTLEVSQPRSLLTAQACAANLPAFLGRLLRGHQHHRGRAVIDARRTAGGDGAVLLEGRLELGHRIERRAVARIFVIADDDVALAGLDGDG